MSKAFDFRSVLKPKVFLTVFNPHAEDLKRDFGGNTYTFPANGTLDIFETVTRKHNREGGFDEEPISPSQIVSHFLGDDGISGHLGPLGVRVLSGDPVQDEEIMADARQVCAERHYLNDCATRNAHMAAVRVAKEDGQPSPTPERHVVEAMNRIEAWESSGGASVLPFKCDDCNMPFKESDARDRHREAQHKNITVAASSSSGEVDALKTTVAALIAQNAAIMELIRERKDERKKPGPKPKVATA